MYDADFEREVQEDYRRHKKYAKKKARLQLVMLGCIGVVIGLMAIITIIMLVGAFIIG